MLTILYTETWNTNSMEPEKHAFRFTPELGQRLRELRLETGLKQAEVAAKMGKTGTGARSIISRLELGRAAHPTLTLIADYLDACGATFTDIADLLSTQQPKSGKQPRPGKPKSREEKIALTKRRATTLHRTRLFEHVLFRWLDDPDMFDTYEQQKALAGYARRLFNILRSALDKEEEARRRLLLVKSLDPDDATGLHDLVVKLFNRMRKDGDLDRRTGVDAAAVVDGKMKLKPVKKAERRLLEGHLRRYQLWFDARHWTMVRVANESKNLHAELGIEDRDIRPYLNVVTDFCTIAAETEPESGERKRRFEERIARATDRKSVRRIGEFAMTRYDQLKHSVPRKPKGLGPGKQKP